MHHRPAPPDPSPAPPVVADDLGAAAAAFFPDATGVSPVAGRRHLLRVETPGGVWVVRRWPAEASAARIAFVHAVLAAARTGGIGSAPAVKVGPPGAGTTFVLGGHRYDARGWLPGRPAGRSVVDGALPEAIDLPAVLAEATVAALAETVAHLHAATAEVTRTPGAPTASLDDVVRTVRGAWSAQRERLRPVAPATPPVQRWLAAGERVLPAALAAFERAKPEVGAGEVVLHLGLWPAHLLYDDAADATAAPPTGVLGWDGVAVGSPLLDLAQLVVRCRGWSAGSAELALAAYGAVRPLSPQERRLLPVVAALDLVAATGRLLVLAYAPRDRTERGVPVALRNGAGSLLASLETAAAVVAQGDEPIKPIGRRWTRRPRPSPAGAPGRGRPAGPSRGRTRPPKPTGGRPTGRGSEG